MTERPIIFGGPMVLAILEGRKSQTRRVLKPQPVLTPGPGTEWRLDLPDRTGKSVFWWGVNSRPNGLLRCPYGVPGDRLFVRESGWQRPERTPRMMREGADTWEPYYFDADITEGDHEQFKEWGFRRRPSIHMPRKFCRLVLEVTAVRVERLQDIDDGACYEEGADQWAAANAERLLGKGMKYRSIREAFKALWDSINAKRAPWESNPWVWVVELRKPT